MQISNIDLQRITYNILLVCPDTEYRRKLKNDLVQEFYQIQFLEADNSDEALNLMNKHNITTTISDIVLPDINGVELFEIAQRQSQDQIPFIFLNSDQENISNMGKVYSIGVLEHVKKSYNAFDLAHKVRNLSHIKIMQDQLQRSSEFNRSLIDSSMDMIVAVDRNRQIIEFNKAAENTFGYKKDEVLGRHISLLYADEADSYKVYENTRQKNNYSGEVLNCRKNGERFTCHLSASVLYDRNGKVMGFMGISRDISGQKEMEKKLEQAREEAESANKMKSQFIASMSHELKIPLNTIMGYSQLFEMNKDLKTDHQAHIQTVKRSASHLSRLIDDIMDLARIEAGQLKLVEENFDIDDLFQDIDRMMSLYIHDKNVNFTIQKEEGIPGIVEGDGLRLRQVLTNLLSNAANFTDEGSIKLKVKTGYAESNNSAKDDNTNLINFQVEDTGSGISNEELKNIFKPFYKAKEVGQRGTGLGLAISSELVNLMGGDMKVISKEGAGSRFYFTIPLRQRQKLENKPNSGDIGRDAIIDDDREWKILIMDEGKADRLMLKNFLEPIGFTCHQAANIEELKEQTQRLSPDILIMEPLQEEMKVSNMLNMVSDEPFRNATKILTSIYDRNNLFESPQAGNIDAILKKPIDFGLLLQVINDRTDVPLSRSKQEQTNEMSPSELYALLEKDLGLLELEKQREFWLGIEVMDVHSILEICNEMNSLPETLNMIYEAAKNNDYRMLLEIQDVYLANNQND